METVQVALRIRPLVQSETSRGCQKCLQTIEDKNQVQIIRTDKSFTYNHVFDESVNQSDFYEQAVKSLVFNLFKGFNVTILAYGQTGSGKTHSMGTCYDGIGEMGVIPRAVLDIFNFIENNSEIYNFQVQVSFMELYNESLYDLLSEKSREQNIIEIREDIKGIKMPGLTEVPVSGIDNTFKCLTDGSARRATGATAMNAQSSRSHAIFTINIYMEKKSDKTSATTAKFHLVDLAGSERSKKTKATGDRFKEGININKGLLALGNVISALGDENPKAFISYRDSKLTRLLQDSLGGNSMTLMIACVSPADYNLEETISTLRYADRARKIKNKPIVNQDPQKAEITRLNQLVHTLRMQLGGDGINISPEELSLKDEKIQKLEMKCRELNSALSLALADNTNMFERQLLIQSSNEKLKQKLLELQQSYNITLSNISLTVGQSDHCPTNIKEEIEKLHTMQNIIADIQTEQKKSEEEILTHEYQTQNTSITTNKHAVKDIDEAQEKYTYQQLNMNRQLQELNKELAMKEKLATQMISNNFINHDIIDYSQFTENELKVNSLEKEKQDLLQQLKGVRTSDPSSKLAEQRRQRVKELEVQITELRKKVVEQARLIKMKEKDELRIKQLNNDIQEMKTNKVKLIKKMRVEEQQFRDWKQKREKEILRLKDQDRKLHNQIVKMENIHNKKQTVLKRKVEEAAAINKRLKDALALQKIVQERRAQNNGKTEKIQHWVSQEVEVMVSTIEAKRSLEQLMEYRATLSEQLGRYKQNPDLTDCSKQIERLTNEIEVRSAHIADLQQKILDSDQENKSKTRWDTVQSMIDAKCALKHLFDLAADIKSKSSYVDCKLEDATAALNEEKKANAEKIEELEEQMALIEIQYSKQLIQITKENEEKVAVLLKHLSAKEVIADDETLKERIDIQTKELQKMSELQDELQTYKEKVEQLESKINEINEISVHNRQPVKMSDIIPATPVLKRKTRIGNKTIVLVNNDPDESLEIIDDSNDPDWVKTPLQKRMYSLRQQRMSRMENKENDKKSTVKRGSDGSIKCHCRNSFCKTNICGCKKLGMKCSDLCKCTDCNNKSTDMSQLPPPSQTEETDSEDSFKKPRILLQEDSDNSDSTPLKYKKSYFH